LGALGGGTLGAMIGQGNAGSTVGHSMGAAVSKWLGAGDYQVSRNTMMSASKVIPDMHRNNQTIVVRHREFVGQITGTSAFSVAFTLDLNPGNPRTFPWLSRMAILYQEYSFKGLVFHYVPTSGMISGGSTALGSVMMQTTYRASDNPPVSKVEMLNEYWANESVPFETFCHPVECDPKENPFAVQYVRSGTIPSGESKLLYDLGTTYVAISGAPANVLGDLWISYEVELKKPVYSSAITSTIGYYAKGGTGTTNTTYLNGVLAGSGVGNLPVTFSGTTITIPAGYSGNYLINISINGTLTGACAFGPAPTFTNATFWIYDGVSANYSPGSATGSNAVNGTYGIVVTDPSVAATFTFPALTFVGTIVTAFVQITQYD